MLHAKHIFHVAGFVFGIFAGYQIGVAIYQKYLAGAATTTAAPAGTGA